MPSPSKWYLEPVLWLEAFVLVNLGFLSLDIYLAHSINQFHHEAEYIPLWFSLAAPPLLLVGLFLGERCGWTGGVARRRLSGRLVRDRHRLDRRRSCTSTAASFTSGRSRAWSTRPRSPPRWRTPAWDCCSS